MHISRPCSASIISPLATAPVASSSQQHHLVERASSASVACPLIVSPVPGLAGSLGEAIVNGPRGTDNADSASDPVAPT